MLFLKTTHVQAFVLLALAAAGGGLFSTFAAAASFTVSDCAGFAALPMDPMTEDVNVFLGDAPAFICDAITTVTVIGPYKFRVTSDRESVMFTKVRFAIAGAAEFVFSLAKEDTLGVATFTGVTDQDSTGGVLRVELGSSATFEVPVSFEGNSVTNMNSGGAVYAGGAVTFQREANFTDNHALRFGEFDAGKGGAVVVGSLGELTFEDFTYFVRNTVGGGGSGGAIANSGSVVFERASRFLSNSAQENADRLGGEGGALFTDINSESFSSTIFRRRTVMHLNLASSGGAIYNGGDTRLESQGFFRGNEAVGTVMGDGGHVHTSGDITFDGDVNFREGLARLNGGSVFIAIGGSATFNGEVDFIDNSAGTCDDFFVESDNTNPCRS